jgi:hypothetical protein
MKPLCVAFLALLALLGTAEARLGETTEEIEKRVGSLKLQPDPRYPEELLDGKVIRSAGFDWIKYTFLKKDAPPQKCVKIFFYKSYKTRLEVEFTPKEVGELLLKNFPDPASAMKIKESRGIVGDVATDLAWEVVWEGERGERARAELKEDEGEWTFCLWVESPSFTAWKAEKFKEEDKAKAEGIQRKTQAL